MDCIWDFTAWWKLNKKKSTTVFRYVARKKQFSQLSKGPLPSLSQQCESSSRTQCFSSAQSTKVVFHPWSVISTISSSGPVIFVNLLLLCLWLRASAVPGCYGNRSKKMPRGFWMNHVKKGCLMADAWTNDARLIVYVSGFRATLWLICIHLFILNKPDNQ